MARRTREGRRISDELLDELPAGDDPAEVFRSGTLIDDLGSSEGLFVRLR